MFYLFLESLDILFFTHLKMGCNGRKNGHVHLSEKRSNYIEFQNKHDPFMEIEKTSAFMDKVFD